MKKLLVAVAFAIATAFGYANPGDITLVSGGATTSAGPRNGVNHIFIDPADNIYTAETRLNVNGQDNFVVRRRNPEGTAIQWTYSFPNTGTTGATGLQCLATGNRICAVANDRLTDGTRRGVVVILDAATGVELARTILLNTVLAKMALFQGRLFVLGRVVTLQDQLRVSQIDLVNGAETLFLDTRINSKPIGFQESGNKLYAVAARQAESSTTLSMQYLDFADSFRSNTVIQSPLGIPIDRSFLGGNTTAGGITYSTADWHVGASFARSNISLLQAFETQKAGPVTVGNAIPNADGTLTLEKVRLYRISGSTAQSLAWTETNGFLGNGVQFSEPGTEQTFGTFALLDIFSADKRTKSNEILAGQVILTNGTTGRDGILISPRSGKLFAFDTDANQSESFSTVAINSKDEVFAGGFATTSITQRVSVFAKFTQAPDAINEKVTCFRNLPYAFDLSENDVAAASSSYTVASNPSNGTVQITPQGMATYSPNTDFVGIDSFSYRMQSVTGTDVATAFVVVQPTIVNMSVPAEVQSGQDFSAGLVLSDAAPEAQRASITRLDVVTFSNEFNVAGGTRSASTTVTAPVVVNDTPVRYQGSYNRFGPFKSNRTVLVRGVGMTLTANQVNPIGGESILVRLLPDKELTTDATFVISYDPQLSGPSSTTLLANFPETQFFIRTSPVLSAANRTIRLTNGNRTISLTLTLQTGALRFFNLRSPSLVGGKASVAFLELTGPVPRPTTFNITYGGSIIGPTTLTAQPGQSNLTLNFTALAVNAIESTSIRASWGQISVTRSLTIVPSLALADLRLAATVVRGGTNVLATIELNAEVAGKGTVVNLSSSNNTVATFNRANITILPPERLVNLMVLTTAVTSNTAVTLLATNGGVTRPATLTVTP